MKSGSGQTVVVCVDSWQAVCWCGLDRDRAGFSVASKAGIVWLVRQIAAGL